MKKVKKILKTISICLVITIALITVFCACFYHITTSSYSLNNDIISASKTSTNLKILDKNGMPINPSSSNYISIKKLSSETKNAFISAEDKRFYTHHGIDVIRLAGATLNNLKSRSFSEGGSTISQQLIKNTHLSSEKTIKRKLREIKLTKELEKQYTKDEILELYLNNIYFGNGCYGIENASNHYFGKSASNLTLAESALLAGTINAPGIYDIEKNSEKAKSRRNLILSLMHQQGKISAKKMELSQNEEINLNITKLSNNNYIWSKVIEEACNLTHMSENELKNNNIEIKTHIDLNLQNKVSSLINSKYSNLESNPNVSSIIIDNKTNGIICVIGNKNSLDTKKQPGSTIKPILVYAPAIEKNMISPATKILDEKIDFNGYSPENADKKYHGYVSVRESLKNSYNIPAVKILNELGIENAQKFANELNITFDENDKNLAIALGGLTTGITNYETASCYACFANGGDFAKCKFISSIKQNEKIIYEDKNLKSTKMSKSTAYLITDMLKDSSKTGTSKKLSNLPYQIASKTGTVGKPNSSKNLEAFNVSYTSEHTILTNVGGTIMPEYITGSNQPTLICKDILEILYGKKSPEDFKIPSSVENKIISKSDYEKNVVIQSNDNKNSFSEVFSKTNPPSQQKTIPNLEFEILNLENEKPILLFNLNKNYKAEIFRKSQNSNQLQLKNFETKNDDEKIKFQDNLAKNGEIYEYFVEFCEKSSEEIYRTKSIKLKSF